MLILVCSRIENMNVIKNEGLFVNDCGGRWGARERKGRSLDGHDGKFDSGAG